MGSARLRLALQLGGAVVALAMINVAYPARFFGIEAEASLAHLHTGLLLAIAMLARSPAWLRVGVLGNLIGWEWRALSDTPSIELAVAGAVAMLATYGLLRAAAAVIRWPKDGRRAFSLRDVARALLVGSILLPLALGMMWLVVAWAILGEPPGTPQAHSGAAQTVLAKCFGTLILTMPLVAVASEWRARIDAGSDLLRIPWRIVLLGGAIPMLLVQLAGSFSARDAALSLFLDYRLILAGLLLVAVVALSLRTAMTLLAGAQALFAIGLAVQAGQGRNVADVLDLLRAGFELVVMQLLVLAAYLYHRERNAHLRDMADANLTLTQRNQELQRFVAVASHDLKEPLRKIQTFGERLRDEAGEQLAERPRHYIDRIHRSASRMRTLIEGLLDYSKVSTASAVRRPVDLRLVLDEVLDDLSQQIEVSKAEIVIGEMPTLSADPLQMHQLLQNLIGNALRYRAPDRHPRIEVDATIATDDDGAANCRLRVADNGIGFEPENAERIFGLFQRLHDRETYEGTGLGLAIVRRIAEQHHGTAVAHGRPGQGAEFIITLRAE